MATVAARHAPSVYTAVVPATILLAYVTAYLDLQEPSVMKVQVVIKTLWDAETKHCNNFHSISWKL